jgi:hypothetical protein
MDPSARFNEIAADLAAENADVELGKTFGMPAIKRGGKATSGFWRDSMVFKLTDETRREEALALDGAERFDPRRSLATPIRGHAGLAGVAVSMGGRPMREWVVVPPSHADEWTRLAREAL